MEPKLHILASVDKIYMRSLKAKYVAYSNLICLEGITHLKGKYYKITPAALKDTAARMTSMYNIKKNV